MKTLRNKRRINDKWLLKHIKTLASQDKKVWVTSEGHVFFLIDDKFYCIYDTEVIYVGERFSPKILKQYFTFVKPNAPFYNDFKRAHENTLKKLYENQKSIR